jgi:hypothetical protein
MEDSGSVSAIASFMTEKLGPRRAVLAVVLAGALVTYGGVSLFVAFFVLAPMGLVKGEGFAVDASVMGGTRAVITARRLMNSIGLRSSSGSVRWLSILRHSKPKRRLKAMPRMTMGAVDPRANDSVVISASRPR